MCPGRPPACVENLVDALAEQLLAGEERDGVEVALHRTAWPRLRQPCVQRNAPVEADHVGAGFAHGGQQARGVDSEIDDGHAQRLHPADETRGHGQDEIAVVGRR